MTTDLGNRIIYHDGTVICSQSALIDQLYAGNSIADLFCNDADDAAEWQASQRLCDDTAPGPIAATVGQYSDIDWYQYWLTPDSYVTLDLSEWCHSRCVTDVEHDRVTYELAEMHSRDMYPVIRHLIYCMDIWRQNGVFWGVGRGSSVCSYVLYLIGINRINPLVYDLDLDEWLK